MEKNVFLIIPQEMLMLNNLTKMTGIRWMLIKSCQLRVHTCKSLIIIYIIHQDGGMTVATDKVKIFE